MVTMATSTATQPRQRYARGEGDKLRLDLLPVCAENNDDVATACLLEQFVLVLCQWNAGGCFKQGFGRAHPRGLTRGENDARVNQWGFRFQVSTLSSPPANTKACSRIRPVQEPSRGRDKVDLLAGLDLTG